MNTRLPPKREFVRWAARPAARAILAVAAASGLVWIGVLRLRPQREVLVDAESESRRAPSGTRPEDLNGRLAAVPERARIHLDSDTLDFGSVGVGGWASGTVVVRNTGTVAIAVKAVTRCGCLRAVLDPTDLPIRPDEERVVRVSLSLDNRAGDVVETIRLVSDSGESRTLTVRANVTGGISSEREGSTPDAALPGESVEARLVLRGSPDLPPWSPVRAVLWLEGETERTTEAPVHSEEIPSGTTGAKWFRVRVPVAMPAAPGRYTMRVRIVTSSPPASWPVAVCSFDVFDAIRPSMAEVRLGVVGDEADRPLRLRLLPARPSVRFEITHVRVREADSNRDSREFLAAASEDAIGWFVETRFIGAPTPARNASATLVVQTNRSDRPVIEVPVTATVPMRLRSTPK